MLRSRAEDVASAGVVALLVGVALICIGAPDLRDTAAFISGSPGGTGLGAALAFSGVLCWALLAALLCVTVFHAVSRRGTAQLRAPRAWRPVLLMVIAAALLVTAILRHGSTDTLCCAGDNSQVQEVVRLAG